MVEIALFVETYPTMPPERREPPMRPTIETPLQAMLYAAGRIPDRGERDAVIAALPTQATGDFIETARTIREAALRTR